MAWEGEVDNVTVGPGMEGAESAQRARVYPAHLAGAAFDFLDHVFGAARTIAAGAVPQADEAHFVGAVREGGVQQPQVAALEGIGGGSTGMTRAGSASCAVSA